MPATNSAPRERHVGAAGARLWLREYGDESAPAVVLLHGFPQTGYCWRAVAPALADRYRVVVPDLPGYGASTAPLSYDAHVLALTVASALRNAGVDRATIVGHDWGGMIAYRLALDVPQMVERLVVINSPFRQIDLRRSWHLAFFNLPVVPEVAFRIAGDRIVDLIHRVASVNKQPFDDATLEVYRAAYRTLERQRSALAYYRTVTRTAIVRALPLPGRRTPGARRAIEAPTLIIWGARDPALPLHLTDGIKRDIPHARVEPIDDAGHFVPEERPEVVVKLIKEFVD